MKYYVTADPHGFYTPLRKALEQVGYFADEGEKKLLICGDLLDRGHEALRTVNFLMEEKAAGRLILITGNHEDLFVHALQAVARGDAYDIACGRSHHYPNGTWHSLLQLSGMTDREAVDWPNDLVRRVRGGNFYRELLPFGVDYYETAHYVFCHGWIPTAVEGIGERTTYTYDPDWRHASADDWYRSRWLNGMELCCLHGIKEEGKTVVCGHFRTSYGHDVIEHRASEHSRFADFSPFYHDGIIALDACTAASGFVNCIVLEDDPLPDCNTNEIQDQT